jgi:hypothetical protein
VSGHACILYRYSAHKLYMIAVDFWIHLHSILMNKLEYTFHLYKSSINRLIIDFYLIQHDKVAIIFSYESSSGRAFNWFANR